jgi:hypothetical protein
MLDISFDYSVAAVVGGLPRMPDTSTPNTPKCFRVQM